MMDKINTGLERQQTKVIAKDNDDERQRLRQRFWVAAINASAIMIMIIMKSRRIVSNTKKNR
jgi:hypothetical protein